MTSAEETAAARRRRERIEVGEAMAGKLRTVLQEVGGFIMEIRRWQLSTYLTFIVIISYLFLLKK